MVSNQVGVAMKSNVCVCVCVRMCMHEMGKPLDESGLKPKKPTLCRCVQGRKGKEEGRIAMGEGAWVFFGAWWRLKATNYCCDPRTLCIYEFPPGF